VFLFRRCPSSPPLPPSVSIYSTQGCYSKFILLYKRPFWRDAGFTGESLNLDASSENHIFTTFDYSTETDAGEVGS
jgi:monoamine oxidase